MKEAVRANRLRTRNILSFLSDKGNRQNSGRTRQKGDR